MPSILPLPVDELIPELLASLEFCPNLVVEAEPGAGKTTRIPAALLKALPGHTLVLEPRRIAARMAARRVAWELGEEAGQSVGYQVRFERVGGAQTRLHFLTEGVLTRRLLSDPDLKGVDAVVLDEFHERHLETDLALTLLRRVQQRRPELRLIIMSATIDSGPVAAFLGGCPALRSGGKVFPLTIEHTEYSSASLEEQTRAALERLLPEPTCGEALVFLPGAAEIRRAMRACEGLAARFGRVLLPLYGSLPPAEQDRAVAPAERPKILFATNVAESSITIPGVRTVVDSGLARISSHSPWTGLPTLSVGRISQASARQRAGRAARTAPGRVLRLYTQQDFNARREFETPEILRSDLAQLCLELRAMGLGRPEDLAWLDAPPAQAVEQAESLLAALAPTEAEARRLLHLPLHPRLARLIEQAKAGGVGQAACLAAALLASGERAPQSDLLEAIDRPLGAVVEQQRRHLQRLARPQPRDTGGDEALLQAVLAGFADRVAQRRSGKQALLANGQAAEFEGEPPPYPLLVALDVEDRTERALPVVRLAARVEPEWLLDRFPERMREETALVWNRQAERAEAVSRLWYEKLALEEWRAEPDAAQASALLAEKALEAGLERFVDAGQLADLSARLLFAGLPEADFAAALQEFCAGMRSFAQLKSAGEGFLAWVEPRLDPAGRLRELAPRTLRLKLGRQVRVHYEPGKPPWVESRLQDFFTMQEVPRLGAGREPIVVHLLAPNQRAVQVTSDLPGFWTRLYPGVRKELMRRYPRHSWPEDPMQPPPGEKGRR